MNISLSKDLENSSKLLQNLHLEKIPLLFRKEGSLERVSKLTNNQVATVQTISGSGALRVGAEFLARFRPKQFPNAVYLPDPTYVNHNPSEFLFTSSLIN